MNIYKSAKEAYLLCTCHNYSSTAFTKLIKKHEQNFTACAKYYFDLSIKMDFAPAPLKEFRLKRVYSNFLDSNRVDEYTHAILEKINTLTSAEKNIINNNYRTLIDEDLSYAYMHLYTVINLIRMYVSKYKYLFIPCTLDYGQDIGLVHQCAIIVDLKNGIFLFYEPYGTYIKYDRNYSFTVKKYLEIYKECLPANFIADNCIKFSSFHEYFFLKKGIQQVILETNNSSGKEYEKNKLILFSDEFKQNFKDLYDRIEIKIKNDDNPVNKTDNTISVLTIMEQFENYNCSPYKEEKFLISWKQALELYHDYNSKTCVSISLVEMDVFFSNINILEYYKKYENATRPNVILMEDLHKLLSNLSCEISNKDEFAKIKTICRKF